MWLVNDAALKLSLVFSKRNSTSGEEAEDEEEDDAAVADGEEAVSMLKTMRMSISSAAGKQLNRIWSTWLHADIVEC